ncbi:STAS domain-containing protein [Metabacillus fastidiosus]|uniref:STAS domain-containing protein n=1 Tax=Metabacillus fastidiosus TaxID=1458 RepID=UPI0008252ECE|nr:STAS domain-containing protein [Metabacillus fastidiosus]MED4463942.1 STAS domain-containing protein [Metabacillus fastidiosus]
MIIDHCTELTDTWIQSKHAAKGTVYAPDAPEKVKERLRKQNKKFIHTIAAVFIIPDKESIYEPIKKWASEVANDRVESNTQISDIISQFKQFRQIYWKKISEFTLSDTANITPKDILEWSYLFHFAFDTLIEEFVSLYTQVLNKNLSAQKEMILELSSPIITLTNKISILPLIGEIDTQRAKFILESTLMQCQEKKVDYLVIDLSGVPIVDTMVANQIFLVVSSVNLLGVTCLITGIRPEVAQTAVQLGIDFSAIPTFSTLQKALSYLHFEDTTIS